MKYYCFVTLWLLAGNLQAQTEQLPYYTQFNLNFQMAVPVEGLRSELQETGIGMGGQLLFQLGRGRPIFAGADFSYVNFDVESVFFTTTQNGFEEDYRLRTRTNALIGHAVLRFKPFTGFFLQPYVDGLFGFKRFYARTTFTQLFDNDEEELIEADTDQADSALSFGLGGGVQWRVSVQPQILIDLRCNYFMGGNASFLVRSSDPPARLEDPIEAFEERRAPTGILLPQIGITFQLTGRDFREVPEEDY